MKTIKMNRKGFSVLQGLIIMLIVVAIAFVASGNLRELLFGTEQFVSCGPGSNYPTGSCQSNCDPVFFQETISGLCGSGQVCCIPNDYYEDVMVSFNDLKVGMEECYEGSSNGCTRAMASMKEIMKEDSQLEFINSGDQTVVNFILEDEKANTAILQFESCVGEEEKDYTVVPGSERNPQIQGSGIITSFEATGNKLCATQE